MAECTGGRMGTEQHSESDTSCTLTLKKNKKHLYRNNNNTTNGDTHDLWRLQDRHVSAALSVHTVLFLFLNERRAVRPPPQV